MTKDKSSIPYVFDAQSECTCTHNGCNCTERLRQWFSQEGEQDANSWQAVGAHGWCCAQSSEEVPEEAVEHSKQCLSRRFANTNSFRLDLLVHRASFIQDEFITSVQRTMDGVVLIPQDNTDSIVNLPSISMTPPYDSLRTYHVVITRNVEANLALALDHVTSMRQQFPLALHQITMERAIQLQMLPGSMNCENCAAKIRREFEEKLTTDASVASFHADLQDKTVTVFTGATSQVRDPVAVLKAINKQSQLLFDISPEADMIPGSNATYYYDDGSNNDNHEMVILDIHGMKCKSCTNKVTEALNSYPNVSSVSVNLENKNATIILNGPGKRGKDLLQIVANLGYQTMLNTSRLVRLLKVKVDGMSCQNCARTVRSLFDQDSTILNVHVDLDNKLLSLVAFPSNSYSLGNVMNIINDETKYKASLLDDLSTSQDQSQKDAQQDKTMLQPDASLSDDDDNHFAEHQQQQQPHLQMESAGALSHLNLQILGMTCASCVSKVERTIQNVSGVKKGVVNLMAQSGKVIYNGDIATKEDIINQVKKMGYATKEIESVEAQEGKTFLQVEGLQTLKDVQDLEALLKGTLGVVEVNVELSKQKVVIEFDQDVTNTRHLVEKINSESQGKYIAKPYESQGGDMRKAIMRDRDINFYKWMFIFAAILTVPSMILMVLSFIPFFHEYIMYEIVPGLSVMALANFLLSTPVFFIAGYKFFILSFKAIRNKSLDMNCLIALATAEAYLFSIGSIIYGIIDTNYEPVEFFETVSSLITFMLLGRLLENIAKRKTSQALVALMDLKPKTALLLDFQPDQKESKAQFIAECKKDSIQFVEVEERLISADLLGRNDIVKILPGDKIPCDGEVIFGTSSVDESMITGESVPILKQINDEVIGGTTNSDGMLLVRALRVGSDTTLSSISKLVEDAQTSKPKIAEIADKISSVFVPVIIAISIATLVIWTVLGYTNAYPADWRYGMDTFVFALRFSVTVVIIACPCALGLATPAALMVGTGIAAKHGVLIKGGNVLEQTHSATVIMFDKTGTLTTGIMGVNQLLFVDEEMRQSAEKKRALLMAIAAAESSSEHPIAKSICAYMREQYDLPDDHFFDLPPDFSSVTGRGVKCAISLPGSSKPLRLVVGNRQFMDDERILASAESALEQELLRSPQTLIYVGLDNHLVCIFGISDQVKPESAAVVRHLQKKLRLDVYMLTGDRREVAEHVANQLGIANDRIVADCTPADKQAKITELQTKRRRVIMVGDGINDSPSLAKADVGMAIGSGTQVASEAADVVLVNNSITSVVNAIVISRVVYRRIIFNFLWAFGYNLLLVPVGAGVFYALIKPVLIPPWAAGAAMILSSLSVLTSSLLLRLYRKPSICRNRKKEEEKKQNV